jgi:hypothetical protein
MALPKIDLPMFELELPSTGEKIKYRPFTVKEEKILLVAQESKDSSQEILAVKQVVNNCLVEKDVSELAMFDLEYVILVLRSRSIDNTIEFTIKDPNTQENVALSIDLENILVTKSENHTNQIKINDEYVLYLKYPTIDEYIKILEIDQKDPLVNYLLMVSCLEKLASDDEVHHFKNYSMNEIDAFVETFSGDVVKKIQQFFETMPKLRHEMKYTNKEGKEQTFVIEGMKSFFI